MVLTKFKNNYLFSRELQFSTIIIISHFSKFIQAAKQGPALSVIPVFMPQNPFYNNLLVFFHLFYKITHNYKSYTICLTLKQYVLK